MATVSMKVFEHHKKDDGTYNVKICVQHKRKRKYLDTVHYVVRKQLTKELKIRDPFVAEKVENQLRDYRKAISDLEGKLDFFTVETLIDYLRGKNKDIDFIKFCNEHIERLIKEGREGTSTTHRIVKNSLIDYFKRQTVSINEIHSNMLQSYEKFLRSERTMKRINQLGKEVVTTKKGLSDSGLHNHMRDLRTLFNAARDRYNNEDLGIHRIKHYPFKNYKIGSAPLTLKRNNTLQQVVSIKKLSAKVGSRMELARDLYLLSFYQCGMNAVDLYKLMPDHIQNGRIDYNRSKTKEKRKDKAFISIKIAEDAKPLLDKYLGQLSTRYSKTSSLNTALSKGMKQISRKLGIPKLTLYWARHTFATVARNTCRMHKDDVAEAMNHVDEGNRMTDIYIAKDWAIVDDVQSAVLNAFKKVEMKLGK